MSANLEKTHFQFVFFVDATQAAATRMEFNQLQKRYLRAQGPEHHEGKTRSPLICRHQSQSSGALGKG